MLRIVCVLILLFAPSAGVAAEFVIFVSVDGLRADRLAGLIASETSQYAGFRRLVQEGAFTFNARPDFFYTNTIPNHASMLTGRPVLVPPGQPLTTHHGYVDNGNPGPGDTLHNQGNPFVPYIASLFDVAHDHGHSTALYASKSKFAIFEQSYDAQNGAVDATGADDGRDKIDVYANMVAGDPLNASAVQLALLTDLWIDPPELSFVHYRDPDTAGHAEGWESVSWEAAVRAVDGYLGQLMDTIEARPLLKDSTVLIVTTDHGGTGQLHGDASDWRNYTIPFFVWGADVPANRELYDLNPTSRANPEGVSPDYGAQPPPIRNADGGNLALDLLGLPPIPGSSINAGQDLRVTDVVTAAPAAGVPVLGRFWAQPNPLNPRARLRFTLGETTAVQITLHDVAGRRLGVLLKATLAAGPHQVPFAPGNLASGIYFARLQAGAAQISTKLVVLK